MWLSAGFEAGAPYAGARTAELEEAKGTSDEIDSLVDSAKANRVPAGPGFLMFKSSQVNTLPIAKSQTRSKQNKGMHKCKSVYSERGVLLPVLTSGGD